MKWCLRLRIARLRGGHSVLGTALISLFLLITPGPAPGQTEQGSEPQNTETATDSTSRDVTAKRVITAGRINPHAPKVDGLLDDEIWQKAEFVGSFTQKDPEEAEAAKNQTEIAIMYDEDAVYIAARMTSMDPDNILAAVTRRDNVSNSERILVSLDTYHDRRTAYTFGVTATGTRVDYYHGSDSEGNRDYNWDPVWRAAAKRTPEGWNAEMRIPFSQLRFQNKEEQLWGMNVNRWVPTGNEDSYWVLVPKNETGWSSKMGEIHGIRDVRPSRRVELMPYFSSSARYSDDIAAADPFTDGNEYDYNVGGDLRMGVGPNLTFAATINPDFGQVEADPAEVNLSPFPTFFDERRPFFTEGANFLEGGGSGYFYSRRIGASPSGFPDVSFMDRPRNTRILGAAKLTGRLNSGLNVGILGAATARETASTFTFDDDTETTGTFNEQEVEPAAGWGTLRLQQEFGASASTGGVILTAVERNMDPRSPLWNDLRKRAYSGGTDWRLRFQGGKYEIGYDVGFSHIEGSRGAIEQAQRSFSRYFQRPDADHTELDTTRTSLTGYTSTLWFEKNAGEHWLWDFGAGVESPEFELNDIGRLGTADDIDSWARLRYRENDPGLFQNWWVQAQVGSGWNFGRDRQYSFLDMESVFTFKNFIGTFLGYEYYTPTQSDNLTQGGPSMGTLEGWSVWNEWWSSGQNSTTWSGWAGYFEDEDNGWSYWLGGGVTVRPLDRLQISLWPNWNHRVVARQLITQESEAGGGENTFGSRYIFANIERSQLRMETRVNFALTPDFTVEFYMEPFAASGRYFNFGELEAARSKFLRHYGTDGTTITNLGGGEYEVTDGSNTFSFTQEDFNTLSFNSNLVVRWEWSPGSTLFLVYQRSAAGAKPAGDIVRPRALLDSFQTEGDSFFALKVTYWIPFL